MGEIGRWDAFGGNDVETVTVQTKDGATWQITKWLTHGAKREIDDTVQEKAFAHLKRLEAQGMDSERLKRMANEPDGTKPKQTNPDEDDALLEACVVSWSYSDPVTPEAIREKPWAATQEVVRVMRELYGLTEEARKN